MEVYAYRIFPKNSTAQWYAPSLVGPHRNEANGLKSVPGLNHIRVIVYCIIIRSTDTLHAGMSGTAVGTASTVID